MYNIDDELRARRDHAIKTAGNNLQYVVRKNTPEYGRGQTDDEKAISDANIAQAARDFVSETAPLRNPWDF